MSATSARSHTPVDDGWAILAQAPGERDLACGEYWEQSLERSMRRRNAPRRSAIVRRGGGRASVALAAVAIGAPVVSGGVATAQSTTATAVSANLSRGSSGAQVRALQSALGISADGIFGPQTEQAVRSYQSAHGIPATGFVGPLTTKALGLSAAGAARSAPVSASGPAAVTLSPTAAKALQRALGVTADGEIGPATRAALRNWEANHGLPADGQPDAHSLKALGVDPQMTPISDTTTTTTSSAPATAGSGVQAAVSAAMSKIGAPYASGATGPSSFDCSGLVTWAMRQSGITVPRTSFAQYGLGTRVPAGSIQAGDLVFFNTAGPGASDVGIATGPATAVSATTHGVMTHPINSGYWGSHFVGARRIA
ncbi:MAG: C40 family peptidase [Solirubrobacteraceae bacterium]